MQSSVQTENHDESTCKHTNYSPCGKWWRDEPYHESTCIHTSIPHAERGGMTNPTFKVERDVVMNPPANTPSIPQVESGGMTNPTINPPANTPIIPHMESGAVAIPKVDKDGGNALINDDSVPVIEIKPTKKRRMGVEPVVIQ